MADASTPISSGVEQAHGQRRRWRRNKRSLDVFMILLEEEATGTTPTYWPEELQVTL